jgi:phage gpG-like protein
MIGLQITGTEQVLEKLGAVTGKVRVAAKSSLDMWARELAGYIKAEKLSGQVLNRRSGSLSDSVNKGDTVDTGSTISGVVRAGLDVPYAKIHEYGGLIPAHIVVATNAKALCFSVGGVTRFAKSVQIPAVNMPERSYMRSRLQDKAPDGIAELRAAVKEAIAA